MSQFLTSLGNITLTVSPHEMYSVASDIEGKIKDSRASFEALIQKTNSTSSYWEGDAGESERKRFENQNENFQKLISNLTNYVSELRAITAIYENSESLTVEYANSLESGILS